MKITAIKQQVKRKERYSIYVDGKYSFSLSENDLIASGLRLNQEITESEVEDLKQTSLLGKAYDRVLNYVAIRPRSRYELEQYMRRKDYDDEVQAAVLEKIERLGFINDLDFAKRWVEWRLTTSSRSKRQLQAELMQKRIDREVIEEVLSSIDKETELEQLKNLIERKRHRYSDERKLMAYLASKGFSYDLIKKALQED